MTILLMAQIMQPRYLLDIRMQEKLVTHIDYQAITSDLYGLSSIT